MRDYSAAMFEWVVAKNDVKSQEIIIDRETLVELLHNFNCPTHDGRLPDRINITVYPQLPTEIFEATLNTDLEEQK